MADVTIIPTSQVATVNAGGQQTQSATEANTPTSTLQQGSLVSGNIIGKDAGGNYLLKTQQGTFALQSATPLTYNSDVTIRIGGNTAGSTSARIVTVNGEPFSEFSAPAPEGGDSVSTALLAPTGATAPEAQTTSTATLPAVVVTAPPANAQQPVSTLLSAGNNVVLRFAQPATAGQQEATAPQTQEAPTPATSIAATATVAAEPTQVAQNPQIAAQQPVVVAQQASPSPATGVSAATATTTTAAPVETDLAPAQAVIQAAQDESTTTDAKQQAPQPQVTTAQSNTPETTTTAQPATVSALYNIYAKSAAPASAGSSAPAPASAAPAGTAAGSAQTTSIPAQVISSDESGNIALQTALGTVAVKAAALPAGTPLTPGASVTLELTAAVQQLALASAPATLTELAGSWQSLKDILSAVANENSPAATALLNKFPQLGPAFVSQSTAFISALIQGDVRKLIGDDTVDILERNGRQDLLDKFSGEVSNLNTALTAATQRQTPSWQTFFLPFVYQEGLQQARLYVKKEPPKKDRANDKSTADTRFIVEVDLSDMGPLQMDGLIRKKEQSTAFDLVIRSHHAFATEDRAEITSIYNSAAQLTGFNGSLAFQVTRDFPVKPLEEATASEDHSITV